ncbi:hypothetical protein NQ315_007171 [Exocentrus adspersus]|uniref:FAM192A/Fyv6 N-terminal domain-containing protein n=1 Tax=Exocentrus adspersus TaxID=1586481 RepID=A0AAV8WE19_9CUCU|nr:hypothetical protein NQ315_007171 [Exocentrus adspersus]
MSSGFISESEAVEIRKRRQEEWERNVPRSPMTIEVCMTGYKNRNRKKDLEYEEAHKLKNMIKGLDDDEIEFLDLVDRTKLEADRKKEIEEERELNDYRNRVAILQEKSIEERLQAEIVMNKPKTQISSRSSQQKLLKGVVIKKNEGTLKRKLSDSEKEEKPCEPESKVIKSEAEENGKCTEEYLLPINLTVGGENKVLNGVAAPASGLKCVGILPGLGCYENSSSDENSSESDIEISSVKKIDILGRKIVEKKESDS